MYLFFFFFGCASQSSASFFKKKATIGAQQNATTLVDTYSKAVNGQWEMGLNLLNVVAGPSTKKRYAPTAPYMSPKRRLLLPSSLSPTPGDLTALSNDASDVGSSSSQESSQEFEETEVRRLLFSEGEVDEEEIAALKGLDFLSQGDDLPCWDMTQPYIMGDINVSELVATLQGAAFAKAKSRQLTFCKQDMFQIGLLYNLVIIERGLSHFEDDLLDMLLLEDVVGFHALDETIYQNAVDQVQRHVRKLMKVKAGVRISKEKVLEAVVDEQARVIVEKGDNWKLISRIYHIVHSWLRDLPEAVPQDMDECAYTMQTVQPLMACLNSLDHVYVLWNTPEKAGGYRLQKTEKRRLRRPDITVKYRSTCTIFGEIKTALRARQAPARVWYDLYRLCQFSKASIDEDLGQDNGDGTMFCVHIFGDKLKLYAVSLRYSNFYEFRFIFDLKLPTHTAGVVDAIPHLISWLQFIDVFKCLAPKDNKRARDLARLRTSNTILTPLRR
ncbi:hypothetical protein BC832DRAFT_206814 [Gaertneriomyces semiglobifer]|nr:hypothetical protein BC832DRAFT_206814 [Gaertneriomyces semiglobifer]